jgi:hypothetical protein
MLVALRDSPPSAVSADVTQRYADGFSDATVVGASSQSAAPAPALLPSIPSTQFLPGTTPNNTATSTANTPQLSGQNVEPNAGNGIVVASDTGAFPGKILFISLGQFDDPQPDNPQYIIVRWLHGGTQFAESKIDLYRSETRHGPWRPITFDLKNTGQHHWPVSVADQMPFYLRVDMRTMQGAFTDFTVQPVALPLNLNAPVPTPNLQDNSAEPQS